MEIESIVDIKVEIVDKKARTGVIIDANLDLLEKDTVRPVFKCKVSTKHGRSLGTANIWVDAM